MHSYQKLSRVSLSLAKSYIGKLILKCIQKCKGTEKKENKCENAGQIWSFYITPIKKLTINLQ